MFWIGLLLFSNPGSLLLENGTSEPIEQLLWIEQKCQGGKTLGNSLVIQHQGIEKEIRFKDIAQLEVEAFEKMKGGTLLNATLLIVTENGEKIESKGHDLYYLEARIPSLNGVKRKIYGFKQVREIILSPPPTKPESPSKIKGPWHNVWKAAYDGDLKTFQGIVADWQPSQLSIREQRRLDRTLFYACRGGNPVIIAQLLDLGADPSWQDPNTKRSSLMIAARWSPSQTLEQFLERGSSVHLKDFEGNSALFYASMNNLENARILLKHGADILDRNKKGQSALMFACRRLVPSASGIINLLLEHGVDWRARDNFGNTFRYYIDNNILKESRKALREATKDLK